MASLVVAMVSAFALAGLFPADPAPPATDVPPIGEPSAPPAAPTHGPPLTAAVRLRPGDLAAGVLNGSLEGRLVYADATLQAACHPERLDDCESPRLGIAGIGLDVVPGETARGAVAGIPDDALLVLRVRGQRLEYLGSLVVHPDGAPSLVELTAEQAAATGLIEPSLVDARGWLVIEPACVTSVRAGCDRPPFLADDEPLEGAILRSDLGEVVVLAPSVWGVDPATDAVSAGPFLVRRVERAGPGAPAWEVVARYDASRSVRVVIP